MCWLLSMCFVWPLKVLQTGSVLWTAFIELSQLRQTVLWEVSSPSSTDLELFFFFFSLERDRPLVTSGGALADGAQWLLLGLVEMLLTRSRLHHPGSDPGNGLSMFCTAKDVPGSLLYLLFKVLCTVSFTKKKAKIKQWSGREHPRGSWLGSTVIFPSHWNYCCIICQCQMDVLLIILFAWKFQSPQDFVGTYYSGCMFLLCISRI